MRFRLSILLAKLIKFILTIFNKRGGSLPGKLAAKLDPIAISKIKLPKNVILITGTNGKTTTTNLTYQVLNKHYNKVVSNIGGDNLIAGITTLLLTNANLNGEIKADALIIEVDELSVKKVIQNIEVSHFIINNLFRDQLDRAGEMENIIRNLDDALNGFKGTLILNGDDPNVARIGYHKDNVIYFKAEAFSKAISVSNEVLEGRFCFNCNHELKYNFYQYSHIGDFNCPNCDFPSYDNIVLGQNISANNKTFMVNNYTFNNPYNTIYAVYNCLAVISLAHSLEISDDLINEVFKGFAMNDGRMETFNLNNELLLNLIKNPTGANEVLKYINEQNEVKNILLTLNDFGQDGRDVSWIYDVRFEILNDSNVENIICTGSRAYDIALCVKYNNFDKNIKVFEEDEDAIKYINSLEHKVYALVTYTALQKTRKILKRYAK